MSNALNNLKSGGGDTGAGVRGRVFLGGGRYGTDVESVFAAKQLYLSNPAIENYWNGVLRKNGIDVTNPLAGQKAWEIAVEGASEFWAASGGKRPITPEQYIGWYARSKKGGGGAAQPEQSRQVYMYDPATVQNIIDKTVTDVLGRKATQDEMDSFYGAIQKMMEEGTVTTTKTRTMNGVREQVTTQRQGFSQAAAESMIEKQLQAQSPEDYAQKKSLDFIDFLFGGGQ